MKRVFDIVMSIVGLILLSPLMAMTAILIKIDSKGTVIYRQERIGKGFAPFTLLKFRTMVTDADKCGPALTTSCDKRITGVGRLLRKTKLDELPQLYNVLRGDMSFVGPRPEVGKYVYMFKDDFERILSVRPGITDYAAIEYRHEEEVLSGSADPEAMYMKEVLPAKIRLYMRYINSSGMLSDIIIIMRTIKAILMPFKGEMK